MLICTRNFGFGCNLGGKKKSAYERACLVGGVVSLGGESRYSAVERQQSSKVLVWL